MRGGWGGTRVCQTAASDPQGLSVICYIPTLYSLAPHITCLPPERHLNISVKLLFCASESAGIAPKTVEELH